MHPFLRRLFSRFTGAADYALTLSAVWLHDRIAGPMPETEADRTREREDAAKVVRLPTRGARLRQ